MATWVGFAVGVVLLVRLAAKAVRAVGYGAVWLDDLALSDVVAGSRFSLVDVVILCVVGVIGTVAVVASRRRSDRDRDGEADA